MKIYRPFKNANPRDISQPFGVPNNYPPYKHTGVDFVARYGTWLQAPEKVQITNIINNLILEKDSSEDLRRGYGIVMKSLSRENTYWLYWHCLPVFPVRVGDIVETGEGVAQMGNSGFVMVGGQYVPISDRLIPPYKGTHLHFEGFTQQGNNTSTREFFDPVPLIDWTSVGDVSTLDEIQAIINIIKSIIKK